MSLANQAILHNSLFSHYRLEPAVTANDMQDFYMSVDSDGNVMWLSPLVIKTMCRLNVRYFPYDAQICNITIGSWMYHGFEIDIWNRNLDGEKI